MNGMLNKVVAWFRAGISDERTTVRPRGATRAVAEGANTPIGDPWHEQKKARHLGEVFPFVSGQMIFDCDISVACEPQQPSPYAS